MAARRKSDGRVHLCCDRIDDKDTFKAVVFAITMMRGGTTPNIANARAARYYGVPTGNVAKFTAQHAARIRASSSARKKSFAEERG